jgi:spore coat protein A, manganese oxidase
MHPITRRTFLRGSGVAALAGWGVASGAALGGLSGALRPGAAHAAVPPAFSRPLPIPEVLTGADIQLAAVPAEVQILDGAPTRMWTFNGSFPGPTIRRPAGERTTVTLHHDLPPAPAGIGGEDSLTLHHHGAHSAPEHDGGPLAELAVHRGETRTYVYDNVEDAAEDGTPLPERAAMQWYHDHTHHRTSFNSYMGLAGLFILDDEFEAGLPLPRGAHEVPLFLTERAFTADNQLNTDIYRGAIGSNIEVFGGLRLVNGAHRPYLEVEPRRYRLRVHNGAGFSLYNLKLAAVDTTDVAAAEAAPAVPLQQIGTESGLLPRSVERTEILLGTAERVDLVVDFSAYAGRNLVLATVGPRDVRRPIAGAGQTAPPAQLQGDPAARDIFLQIRVGAVASTPDEGPVPQVLRPLPDWAADVRDQPDRVFVFGSGVDPARPTARPHSINGRPFDPDRVDATPELGSVESWLLLNASQKTHYIHLHDVDWLVVSRNGAPPPPHEAGLKETFKIDPGEFVLVAAKFSDHLGPYMIHCHMLDHEDSGMMTRWDVVAPGQGQPTTLTADERRRTDALLAAARENPGCPAPAALVEALVPTVVLADDGSPYTCRLG